MDKEILNKEGIKQKYQDLVNGKTFTPQQRGLEFEKLIYSLLHNENLEPKASYKPKGEQIDGSFFWQGQTFLLEAKWVNDPIPVSSIYSFKGKLDGKFHTTSGVFISVSGYSDDVEDALKFGKSLNILLFDETDIPIIFNGEIDFLEVLKFKLREAGDTGSLKAPYELKERAKEISKTNPESLTKENLDTNDLDKIVSKKVILIDDILIFVEGKTDIPIIKNLIEPIKNHYSLSYKIEVLNGANGIRQLPSLLSIYGDLKKTKAVIVFLDDDQASKQMEGVIENITEQLQKSSISIKPIFLYINESLKETLAKAKLTIDQLRREFIFGRLETFIQQIEEEYYYDPEIDIPNETLENTLARLEWDFKNGVINGPDNEAGHSSSIESLEELIEYLNDEMINAMNGEMPMYWLKGQDFLDYETEVKEYLYNNYLKDIKKMGWDYSDL